MVKRQIWRGMLVILLTFVMTVIMTVIGCKNDDEEDDGPPSSVSEYYAREPAMADNPNRAVLREGGRTTIRAPAYLSRAAGDITATFTVNAADTGILHIDGSNRTTYTGIICTIIGDRLGSARITVTVGSNSAVLIITVSPSQSNYTLPPGSEVSLGDSTSVWSIANRPDSAQPNDINSYISEPTYQLAWNWRNPTTSYGASGKNCGIDILAYYVDPEVANKRGWVRTTFGFGGWHYDLNGVSDQMTNGVQVNGNVSLRLTPEFVYDGGVPYLQITHTLTNTGSTKLTGQKFGASADVMIFNNDKAGLTYLPYGALMTDKSSSTTSLPTLKLRLVCQNVRGVNDVDTLWLGQYHSPSGDSERKHVYDNKRDDIAVGAIDTALNFSYQNITLEGHQSKSFVVRFTQVQ